jgi:hypothetical protein
MASCFFLCCSENQRWPSCSCVAKVSWSQLLGRGSGMSRHAVPGLEDATTRQTWSSRANSQRRYACTGGSQAAQNEALPQQQECLAVGARVSKTADSMSDSGAPTKTWGLAVALTAHPCAFQTVGRARDAPVIGQFTKSVARQTASTPSSPPAVTRPPELRDVLFPAHVHSRSLCVSAPLPLL